MNGLTRRAAAEAYMRIEEGGYANLVICSVLEKYKDRVNGRFVSACALGAAERSYTLEYLLSGYLNKPFKSLDPEISAILKTCAYEMLFMDGTEAYAVVNEGVELARSFKKSSAAGLVNAVLRRVAKAGKPELSGMPLNVRYSVHPSIAKMLAQAYTDADRILESFFRAPESALRVNSLKTDEQGARRALEGEGFTVIPSPLQGALRIAGGNAAASECFKKGLVRIQSEASQYAALCVGARPGERVIDLCAAPGGKTLTIAQCMNNSGKILAFDIHEKRVGLIGRAAMREGVTIVSTGVMDAAIPAKLPPADRVLCDIPCSGLGVIGAKPDIRMKDVSDLSELIAIQRRIVENAAKYVKPGGRLTLSTCTLNPEENERTAELFLNEHPEFFACAPDVEYPGARRKGEFVYLMPHETETDGFFVANFTKTW